MKKIYEKIQEKYWICHEKYIFAFPDFPRFFWWNYIWLLLRAVQKLVFTTFSREMLLIFSNIVVLSDIERNVMLLH